MTFNEALKYLKIEEFKERIFNSNSHGELFHIGDYINLAIEIEEGSDVEYFSAWFKDTVKEAEKEWKRPESIFQHIPRLLAEQLDRDIEEGLKQLAKKKT